MNIILLFLTRQNRAFYFKISKKMKKNLPNSPKEFIEKLSIANAVIQNEAQIKLTPLQLAILELVETQKINIFFKKRQEGYTILATMYALWKALTNDRYNILIITDNFAMNLIWIKYIKKWHKNVCDLYGQNNEFIINKISARNDGISFKNGSTISFLRYESIRGLNVDLVILDEFTGPKLNKLELEIIKPAIANSNFFAFTSLYDIKEKNEVEILFDKISIFTKMNSEQREQFLKYIKIILSDENLKNRFEFLIKDFLIENDCTNDVEIFHFLDKDSL